MPLSHTSHLGRNDPCHCGSGKKYKKCCIHINASAPALFEQKEDEDVLPAPPKEALIHTTTGEPFMPARLYYRVHDRQKVAEALLALKCVDQVDDDTFDLSYWHEAQRVQLKRRYNQVPEDVFPVHLATCRLRGDAEMVVDVRSFERAWRLIIFLDRHIRRKFAEVTHIATYNRLVKQTPTDTMAEDILSWDYDALFSPDTMKIIEDSPYPDEDDETPVSEEEEKKIAEDFAKNLNEPFPKTTKMPTHFYEEGIKSLSAFLTMRMLVAGIVSYEDDSFTAGQVFERMVEKFSPEPVD